MSLFTSLADLQKATEVPEYTGGSEKYFTIKDKEKFLIRFRQELVQDAPGFDEAVGSAQVVSVHTSPLDFKKSATCTAESEKFGYKCWACDQVGKDTKWRGKQHLLINIAVFDAEEKVWIPKVLDQKFTSAHVAQGIVDMAVEFGSLLTHDYRISRVGEKTKTQYNLLPVGEKNEDPSIAGLEYFDLSSMHRIYAPNEQQGYYLAEEDKGSAEGWS